MQVTSEKLEPRFIVIVLRGKVLENQKKKEKKKI